MASNYDFRIIIIDDNPSIHKDFIKILTNTQSGSLALNELNKKIFGEADDASPVSLPAFNIDTATQGQQGVESIAKAIKEGNPYALAFVDIRMPPGWDGIETIKHIWALDKNIQIVICTAYSDYSWEETIKELGQNDNLLILKKPFDQIAVRQLTCALTKKWQLMNDVHSQMKQLEQCVQDRTDSLQQSLSIKHATLESSADGIIVSDLNGKVIDHNDKFISMCQITKNTIEKDDCYDIFKKLSEQIINPAEYLKKINDIRSEINEVCICIIKFKDNRSFEYYTQPHKLNEKILGRVWSFRDITKRAQLEDELLYQATHDALTHLPNRVLLSERLHKAIDLAKSNNTHFAVLFFDLDRFKLINDSLSHAAGDDLLSSIAKRLQSVVKPCDTLARLGGDEFIMIINNLNKPENAIKIAAELLHKISNPFIVAGRKLIVTTSIGISIYPRDGDTADDLLRNADAAMYNAKAEGANQFRFYSAEMNAESIKRLELEYDLRQAIKKNEFALVYQPQYDIETNQIVAAEALIRWNHSTKGCLLPIDFIPLAEDTGLIVPIGEWVLRAASKQNKAWQDAGFPFIRVAINVTSEQLRQLNFIDLVREVLEENKIEPKYIEIELTENSILTNPDVIDTIHALKQMGLQIALDDFGAGLSSLNYLRNFPLDRIKIDSSYVQNILTNRGDEVIIQAIITMARSLNLEVLAEGVETKEQFNFLKERKCGEIQGHFYSKALSVEEIEKVLRTTSSVGQ